MLRKILYIVLGILVLPIWTVLFFMLGQNGARLIDTYANKEGFQSVASSLPKMYIVESGSMEPAVKVGSVVFVSKAENYLTGDVVSFDLRGDGKNIITHRIAYKKYPEGTQGSPVFVTKGDANEDFDSSGVQSSQIVGKMRLSVPYLGYVADFAKKPWGFILLVIVPATILIYEELRSVVFEIAKKIKKRKKEGSENERGIKKSFTFIPVFGALFVMASVTASFLSDTEGSRLNIFQASSDFGGSGETTPTPTPTGSVTPTPTEAPEPKLVINEVYYDTNDRTFGDLVEQEGSNEWIEIYNPTTSEIPFKNWQICDNTSCVTINIEVNVPALGFALVSEDLGTWNFWSVPPGVITVSDLTGTSLALSNTGDRLILKNPIGEEIDRMSYGGDTSVFDPACPDVAEGHSLERNPDGYDTDSATDFVNNEIPTPGS